jgi:anti-sigma factor RsiW
LIGFSLVLGAGKMDDRTEHLITRRLDGEITADESLELDKQLIRSPEARMYLDEQERIDALAGEALRAALAPDDTEVPAASEPTAWPVRVSPWRRYLQPAAAVAAAVGLAVLAATIPSVKPQTTGKTPAVVMNNSPEPTVSHSSVPTVPVADDDWADLPRSGQHRLIGVYDEGTQSFYLLEMNRRFERASQAAANF